MSFRHICALLPVLFLVSRSKSIDCTCTRLRAHVCAYVCTPAYVAVVKCMRVSRIGHGSTAFISRNSISSDTHRYTRAVYISSSRDGRIARFELYRSARFTFSLTPRTYNKNIYADKGGSLNSLVVFFLFCF